MPISLLPTLTKLQERDIITPTHFTPSVSNLLHCIIAAFRKIKQFLFIKAMNNIIGIKLINNYLIYNDKIPNTSNQNSYSAF